MRGTLKMNHVNYIKKTFWSVLRMRKALASAEQSYSIIVQRRDGTYFASIRELCLSHSSKNFEDVLGGLLTKELKAIHALNAVGEFLPPKIETLERKSLVYRISSDLMMFSVKSLLVVTVILVTTYSYALNKIPIVIPMAKERLTNYIETPPVRESVHRILNSLEIKACIDR
jgi:hypothetical protein